MKFEKPFVWVLGVMERRGNHIAFGQKVNEVYREKEKLHLCVWG